MACQGFQFTGTTLTVAKPTLERTISRWEIGASLPDIYLRSFYCFARVSVYARNITV